jgi:hypothetical protein
MTTIEVGKFYKTQLGNKLEVVAIRGDCVLGAIHYSDGTFVGTWGSMSQAQHDLTPWIDEPAIPWDSVPEWCQWWAVTQQGCQIFFEERPIANGLYWSQKTDTGVVIVPKHHRIPYTGNWNESLRQRPGKEVKP